MDNAQVEKSAQKLFESGWYCAESVLLSLCRHIGTDPSIVPQIATGFCGGVSRTGGMCGAVSGGVMALGLVFGRTNSDQPATAAYEKVQEFLKSFKEKHGSVNCYDLIGIDLGTDEGQNQFKESAMRETCAKITGNAAGMVAGILDHKSKTPVESQGENPS